MVFITIQSELPLAETTFLSISRLKVTNPVVASPLELEGTPGVVDLSVHTKSGKAHGVVVEPYVLDKVFVSV